MGSIMNKEDKFEIQLKTYAELALELDHANASIKMHKEESDVLLRERNRYSMELESMIKLATTFEKALVCIKIAALQKDNEQVVEIVDDTISDDRFKSIFMQIMREP